MVHHVVQHLPQGLAAAGLQDDELVGSATTKGKGSELQPNHWQRLSESGGGGIHPPWEATFDGQYSVKKKLCNLCAMPCTPARLILTHNKSPGPHCPRRQNGGCEVSLLKYKAWPCIHFRFGKAVEPKFHTRAVEWGGDGFGPRGDTPPT